MGEVDNASPSPVQKLAGRANSVGSITSRRIVLETISASATISPKHS